jgi:hypothetical protein
VTLYEDYIHDEICGTGIIRGKHDVHRLVGADGTSECDFPQDVRN